MLDSVWQALIELGLIIGVNCIFIPCYWFGLVVDDATAMVLNPFRLKQAKVFSIAIHLVVAFWIYIAFGLSSISLIASILFSVHPNCVQVACWRSGGHYGINALYMLLIIALAPYGAFFYLLGVRANATLALTPLIFIFSKHWFLVLLAPLVFWWYWQKIKLNIEGKKKGGDDGIVFVPAVTTDFDMLVIAPRKLIIAVKTFGFYALNCLLPLKNGFYNSFLQTFGASLKDAKYWYSLNRHFWGGLFAIIVMAYLWFVNRSSFIGMGIVLFVVSIAPFLNFISVQQFTSARYAYLPLVGFQIALVGLLHNYLGIYSIIPIAGLFTFYLDRLLRVMRHYKTNNIDMYLLERQEFPDNPRLWYFMYAHWLHKGNPILALAESMYGLKTLPQDCQLWFGATCAAFEMGDYKAASAFLDNSEKFMVMAGRTEMKTIIEEMRTRIRQEMGLIPKPKIIIPNQNKKPFYRGLK